MSFTFLTFTFLEYYPLDFDFTNFVFEIFSELTTFKSSLPYDSKSKMTDKTSLKTDLKYYVKALLNGELIGMGSFIVPSSILFHKSTSLLLKSLPLTVPEYIRKRLFPFQSSSLAIDLKVSLSYATKHLNFKRKIRHNSVNTSARSMKSSNSSLNTFRIEFSPSPRSKMRGLYYRKQLDNLSPSASKKMLSNPVSPNASDSESEISVKASVLNETKCGENTIGYSLGDAPSTPIDVEIDEKLNQMGKIMIRMQIDYAKEIDSLMQSRKRLVEAMKSSNEKLRSVYKKSNKFERNRIRYDIDKGMNIDIGRKERDIVRELGETKKMEENVLSLVFGECCNMGNNIMSGTKEEKEKEKQLLLRVIKRVLDLNIDLSSCFNSDGIERFKYICTKYELIENGVYKEIKEEEAENEE